MPIYLGSSERKNIYLGSTQIQKVYLGTTQLYTAFEVVINGTENTLTESTSSSDQSVRGFTLRTDGYTYNYANTEESIVFANWGSPVGSTGAGNNYWVNVGYNVNDPTPSVTVQGTFNTWLQINTARSFGYYKPSTGNPGTNEVEFQVQIATDSLGSNIVGTVLWTVNRTYF